MSGIRGLLAWRITSDVAVARVGQFACYLAAPAMIVLAMHGLARYATTPGEAFIGVLAASAVSLSLVTLGLLLHLVEGRASA